MVMPSPPAITPYQMNLLRAVTAMAWSDGSLEAGELELMATQLAQRFAQDPDQQEALAKTVREYFTQQIPLAEVLPKITQESDRRLILKLGYLVIAASARSPEEPVVNVEELDAFQQLVNALNLSPEAVHQVSAEAEAELTDASVAPLEALIEGFSQHYQA
jgi:hypothetical protein